MHTAAQPRLSLAEWLVLCLICEAPSHGFALVRTLSDDGDLGKVWRVPKPVIYRALQRLEAAEMVETVELQPSSEGPVRALVDATGPGREAATEWLAKPARHNREVRSELLIKLALLDRTGGDPAPLLRAQREQLEPVAEALRARLTRADGFDRTILSWRWETAAATLRFLDDALRESAAAEAARAR
jgi:DNA-binding PadR family transcriptional regulator